MRSVFWEDDHLKMIDQRRLPHEFAIAEYDDVRDVANGIRDMVVRGAPAIGAAAAFGMALAAANSRAADREAFIEDLQSAKQTLDTARPTAVNLAWATLRHAYSGSLSGF